MCFICPHCFLQWLRAPFSLSLFLHFVNLIAFKLIQEVIYVSFIFKRYILLLCLIGWSKLQLGDFNDTVSSRFVKSQDTVMTLVYKWPHGLNLHLPVPSLITKNFTEQSSSTRFLSFKADTAAFKLLLSGGPMQKIPLHILHTDNRPLSSWPW